MVETWPPHLPTAQVRIARPTNQLAAVVNFYRDGLGLQELTRFEGHTGFTEVILGLPGFNYHLEFTQHQDGNPGDAPSEDNLLVFYIPDTTAIEKIVQRLATMGYTAVPPFNPYWAKGGITIPDPDGWRVVLYHNPGLGH